MISRGVSVVGYGTRLLIVSFTLFWCGVSFWFFGSSFASIFLHCSLVFGMADFDPSWESDQYVRQVSKAAVHRIEVSAVLSLISVPQVLQNSQSAT